MFAFSRPDVNLRTTSKQRDGLEITMFLESKVARLIAKCLSDRMSRLHEDVMTDLLAEIALGERQPGDMLPREIDLVDRFGVSRGVIRESLRGLEERGVISVKHGRGATVAPREEWDVLDPDVLKATLAAPEGEKFVDEALECQRLIEVEAAGLAAERADTAHLEGLTHALERMTADAGHAHRTRAAARRYQRADVEFHRMVVHAAGNRALAQMSAPLHRALTATSAEPGDSAAAERHLSEHRGIVVAIENHDPDAARTAMADHLARALRRF
jgi:DNA-binding FadR family transcriptional regulator